MKEFNMTGLRERLDQLSTDELDAMLNAELERDEPDPASVRLLMDILEGKDTALVEITPKKEAAWKRYQERVRGIKKKSSRSNGWLLKVASVVLVVGLLFAVVPQEVEAESLWDVIIQWTKDAVEWFNPIENKEEIQFPFQTDNSEMQKIYESALELGIEQPLIPMWFPEGYVLDEIKTKRIPGVNGFSISLIKENQEAVFQIRVFTKDSLHGYFGEEESYQRFEREGAEYKLTKNENRRIAVWKKNNIEYFLTLDCQEDTLQRILDSIYVMEDIE